MGRTMTFHTILFVALQEKISIIFIISKLKVSAQDV